MSPNPEGLEADVDTRLAEIWSLTWDRETLIGMLMNEIPELAQSIGSLMRAAYGKGYGDALLEEEGRRGELATAHGYTIQGGSE